MNKKRTLVFTVITMAWVYLAAMISSRFFPSDWLADVVLVLTFGSIGVVTSFALDFLVDQKLAKRPPKDE